jgi:triacylglycerol lipase
MQKLGVLVALSVVAAMGCSAASSPEGASGPADEQASSGDAFTAHVSRHAIVLAHGFGGSDTNRWSFFKVAEQLRSDGDVVHEAKVAPFKGVSERAAELAKDVTAAQEECKAKPGCDASKVHIIAHSMGGLDARFLIAKLGFGDRVASLTTISTPHRGSAIADVLLKIIPDNVNKALSAIASVYGRTFTDRDLADGSDLKAALSSISEKTTHETFNPDVQDDPRVTYLSWAGVSEIIGIPNPKDQVACEGTLHTRLGIRDGMDLSLVLASPFVAHGLELRPNDGFVTVESAKWGKFMGCIPADHLDEVGQPKDNGNPLTGFDHLVFYRQVASSLDDEVAAHARATAAAGQH